MALSAAAAHQHSLCQRSPFCCSSQDNWDDEDEDEEKKAEVTKTGTAGILPTGRGEIVLDFLQIEMSCFTFQRPKSLTRRS